MKALQNQNCKLFIFLFLQNPAPSYIILYPQKKSPPPYMHPIPPKFNTTRTYLLQKIFIPQPPQQGQIWTNLNITILPDYLAYLKLQLTNQERIVLSDYHLQTFLLETALKPHPKNDFDVCTQEILRYIREHGQFWVRKIGEESETQKMHQAIQEYHKDIDAILQCNKEDEKTILSKQTEYQLKVNQIIDDDYVYFGNKFMKGAHRFIGNLYPWVGEYVIGTVDGMSQKEKENFKLFSMQFLMNLAAKAKPRCKQFHFPGQSDQSLADDIETQVKKFAQYSQKKTYDSKSLSSPKDYHLLANSLFILTQLAKNLTGSQVTSLQSNQNLIQKQKKVQEIYCDLVNRFITKEEVKMIIEALEIYQYRRVIQIAKARAFCQEKSKTKWAGVYDANEQDIQKIFQSYNEIINHPENTNRMKYKLQGSEVGWSDELYLKFLEKFLQFFNVPTNNKKIAQAMGKDIQPNHVKHVKGLYVRNMALRIDNGEIGGGKKGVFESKIEFLKKDIQNFNMRWFKKETKRKTKKIKKRRKRQTFNDEEQHDSDY